VTAAAVVAALKFTQCNVLWRSLHGQGVQDVESLILVGAFFLPSVAPVSQGSFGVTELGLFASVP
jgi:hypothetical protein